MRSLSRLAHPRLLVHRTVPSRPFSSTPTHSSHIGSAPISIPTGVTLSIPPQPVLSPTAHRRDEITTKIDIKGPLGELALRVPSYVSVKYDEENAKVSVAVLDHKARRQREMWGTTRAYLSNYVLGVSEGHSCILRLVGVGYRAVIENKAVTKQPEYEGQQFVSLKVGYSHPIELGVPRGVKASTPQPTRILLEGMDKETIKSFAARIRKWRVPEPYKGKGIFVDQETIKLKSKKIR